MHTHKHINAVFVFIYHSSSHIDDNKGRKGVKRIERIRNRKRKEQKREKSGREKERNRAEGLLKKMDKGKHIVKANTGERLV